jgi:rubrerythrin
MRLPGITHQYVCEICGNTVYDAAPDKCQVCGVPKKRFTMID